MGVEKLEQSKTREQFWENHASLFSIINTSLFAENHAYLISGNRIESMDSIFATFHNIFDICLKGCINEYTGMAGACKVLKTNVYIYVI